MKIIWLLIGGEDELAYRGEIYFARIKKNISPGNETFFARVKKHFPPQN